MIVLSVFLFGFVPEEIVPSRFCWEADEDGHLFWKYSLLPVAQDISSWASSVVRVCVPISILAIFLCGSCFGFSRSFVENTGGKEEGIQTQKRNGFMAGEVRQRRVAGKSVCHRWQEGVVLPLLFRNQRLDKRPSVEDAKRTFRRGCKASICKPCARGRGRSWSVSSSSGDGEDQVLAYLAQRAKTAELRVCLFTPVGAMNS